MDLFKFPRTKHLFDAGGSGVSRDDLLMDPGEEGVFYSRCSKGRGKGKSSKGASGKGVAVAMEEKVDGANLGLSMDKDTLQFKVQNRSHYINSKTHRQFGSLDSWLSEHSEGLYKILGSEPGRHVLFGEWVYATHSIAYTRLPDYFLAFDVYDLKVEKFLSWRERNKRLKGTGIHPVRLIAEETLSGREDVSVHNRTRQIGHSKLIS
jgi:atypical dual specificity phosphatase